MKSANKMVSALMQYLHQPYAYVLPNVFIGRWERDVVRLDRKSGWWSEYEIKISRSDFKQDFKKEYKLWNKPELISKHGQFKAGEATCPNRFWFVVPENLIKPSELPPYAGLIYFSEDWGATAYAQFQIIRAAKIVHRTKVSDAWKVDLLEKCYFRYHDIKFKLENMKARVDMLTEMKKQA